MLLVCVGVAYYAAYVTCNNETDAPSRKEFGVNTNYVFRKFLEEQIKQGASSTLNNMNLDQYNTNKMCFIKVTELPIFHPWILHPKTHQIIYPQEGDVLTLKEGDEVQLVCSGKRNYLNRLKEAYKFKVAIVHCANGQISYQGRDVNVYAEWDCLRMPETTIRLVPNTKCRANTLPVYRVGFWVGGFAFTHIYELCVDNREKKAIRTRFVTYKIRKGGLDGAERVDLKGIMNRGLLRTFSDLEFTTEPSFIEILRRAENAEQVKEANRLKYVPYFLCPAEDMYYLAEQLATYYVANIAYQWVPFHRHNWKRINEDIHQFARDSPDTITMFSGVLDKLQIDKSSVPAAVKENISNEKAASLVPVPAISWKVVNVKIDKGIAIIGHNKATKQALCTDHSSEVPWLRQVSLVDADTEEPVKNDPEKGFMYACLVNSFREHGYLSKDLPKMKGKRRSGDKFHHTLPIP